MVDTLTEDEVVVTQPTNVKKDDSVGTDAQLSNDVAESETLPDTSVEKYESELNKDVSNSETKPNNELGGSETLATNGEAVKLPDQDQNLDNSEEPASDHPENYESLTSNHDVGNSETETSNGVVESEKQHTDEVVMSGTVQGNEGIMSETQQSNEVALSETQLTVSVRLQFFNFSIYSCGFSFRLIADYISVYFRIPFP